MSPRAPAGGPPAVAEESAADGLLRLARETMRVIRGAALAEELSIPQFLLLSWLRRDASRPTIGWSERVGVSPSTASELVEGLRKLGLVERAPDPSDRRRVLIGLSANGRRRVDRVREKVRTRLRGALAPLPAAELSRIATTLESLAVRLEDGSGRERRGGRNARGPTSATRGLHG